VLRAALSNNDVRRRGQGKCWGGNLDEERQVRSRYRRGWEEGCCSTMEADVGPSRSAASQAVRPLSDADAGLDTAQEPSA
jgi:hypothetical protein